MAVVPAARTGFANGAAYDSVRPSYPASAVAAAGVTEPKLVVDLAAGTGKLTRVLKAMFPRVVAIEPSASMREASGEGIAGTAEAIPLRDDCADAVFVAQAFHWFDVPTAAAEIARVLRPGGTLAVLANHERWHDDPWLVAVREVLAPYKREARFPSGDGKWEDDVPATGRFAPWCRATFDHVLTLDRDGFVTLVSSYSWIANLPDDERAQVAVEIARLAPTSVRLRYETEVLTSVALE